MNETDIKKAGDYIKFRTVLLIIACILLISIAQADTLVLPEKLERIETEAFMGIASDYVEFHADINYIADDAFEGATFIGVGAPGIYAQGWCEDHGFEYQAYATPLDEFEYEDTAGELPLRITSIIPNWL